MTVEPEPAGAELVLVVDDDADIARFVEVNLRLQGFHVMIAHDGAAALDLIDRHHPALAIVDLMMPVVDGIELTRRVRANPLTAAIPIIMLTARGLTVDKVHGLTAGADDYLVKPFDTTELLARVRGTLRRSQDNRELSPLTGLPGNNRILREVSDRIRRGVAYAVGHIDIDRFKSVNDAYGFARGDEFISALAQSLQRAVVNVGPPPAFLGHIGGDDFIIVCTPEQMMPLTEQAILDFQAESDRLYDPVDAERGYLELEKRNGEKQLANLVTLSIGVALSTYRSFADPREVVAVASEMKTVAKERHGNWVAYDRRRHRLD